MRGGKESQKLESGLLAVSRTQHASFLCPHLAERRSTSAGGVVLSLLHELLQCLFYDPEDCSGGFSLVVCFNNANLLVPAFSCSELHTCVFYISFISGKESVAFVSSVSSKCHLFFSL